MPPRSPCVQCVVPSRCLRTREAEAEALEAAPVAGSGRRSTEAALGSREAEARSRRQRCRTGRPGARRQRREPQRRWDARGQEAAPICAG
ncbi:hypothetical protein U9M48_001763 [Paspalum notatum var. saurae]|uniref:Uncharacterized protein n=1 Tax=Paspalum notatum var. saurae TaxID=547442 RepID=A0AAQ3PGU3_PASNO